MRAALDAEIVYVALPQAPPAGRNTLQLYVGDELVGAVSAELVGSGRDGAYPLRMRLLDPAHAQAFEALADRPSAVGPRPSRKSIREAEVAAAAAVSSVPPRPLFEDEQKTLPSHRGEDLASAAEDSTLTSRELPPARETPPPPSSGLPAVTQEGEPVATTVFDPEGVLRAQPIHTGSVVLTLQRLAASLGPEPSRSAPPRAGRESFFNDEESQTLPGSTRNPGQTLPTEVSWNVRIAPNTKDPLCGRTVGGGKYVLDSVIGTGAIGIVFKASHRDLGRTIAIKVLNPRYRDDPDLLAVFRTEARAASLLEHPNVARVYDYGQEPDGLVYIVMEYLSGYTLGSVLDARRKLTAARTIDLMMQTCAGLSAAHDRDIVHRDVKPDNIVLVPAQDDEGRPVEIVKVCDFGIAALGTTKVEEATAVGTPDYMAPEQSTGSAAAPSADVYACGCVLYEMLTGQVPFSADQAYRILMKHRTERPRAPSTLDPSISPALEAVVLRCMEKLPERRYQSARELRAELRKLAETKA